jgi:hypothetical protein
MKVARSSGWLVLVSARDELRRHGPVNLFELESEGRASQFSNDDGDLLSQARQSRQRMISLAAYARSRSGERPYTAALKGLTIVLADATVDTGVILAQSGQEVVEHRSS